MEKLIPIELTRSERELILNIQALDKELERKLNVTVMYGNAFLVKLPLEKMNTLLESLEGEVKSTEDANLHKGYSDLHDKLERIIKANQ
jgi:hypothetical protein